jgi:lipase maturation factor
MERIQEPAPFWLTRFLILRVLGGIYFFAFLAAARQIVPLIGEQGLTPLRLFFDRIQGGAASPLEGFLQFPSLFWLDHSDAFLQTVAWIGAGLSLVVLLGYANGVILALLWALYMSFVHVGQDWYGYGWEIQLLETGFLAIFLCPLLDGRPFPRRPPPVPVVWLFRWLIFRIMLGAGLIKIRGDSCWRDLTCLAYHYETQPIPNPLSRTLHFMPLWFHRGGCLFNHLVELGCPWLLFSPRRLRHAAGLLMLLFQIILILSGNLSFLNYLTIVPILACFDDRLLERLLPGRLGAAAGAAAASARPSSAQRWISVALAALVAWLSIDPVLNLFSVRQAMNRSFGSLDLVNTYGAFGSVGRERDEIVFEGTEDATLTEGTRWREYPFVCKPGDIHRRPCFAAPYQPRIDWQIWFAAMSTPQRYPWTLHLVWKLLHGDPGALSLLAGNPFPKSPPRFIRARLFRYRFAPPGQPDGAWWRREELGLWIPPLSEDDPRLLRFLSAYGWLPEEPPPEATEPRR